MVYQNQANLLLTSAQQACCSHSTTILILRNRSLAASEAHAVPRVIELAQQVFAMANTLWTPPTCNAAVHALT